MSRQRLRNIGLHGGRFYASIENRNNLGKIRSTVSITANIITSNAITTTIIIIIVVVVIVVAVAAVAAATVTVVIVVETIRKTGKKTRRERLRQDIAGTTSN